MITQWTYEKRVIHSYKQPLPQSRTKPLEWTPEQLEEWRNNLRRMGKTVTDKTFPYTGR